MQEIKRIIADAKAFLSIQHHDVKIIGYYPEQLLYKLKLYEDPKEDEYKDFLLGLKILTRDIVS